MLSGMHCTKYGNGSGRLSWLCYILFLTSNNDAIRQNNSAKKWLHRIKTQSIWKCIITCLWQRLILMRHLATTRPLLPHSVTSNHLSTPCDTISCNILSHMRIYTTGAPEGIGKLITSNVFFNLLLYVLLTLSYHLYPSNIAFYLISTYISIIFIEM